MKALSQYGFAGNTIVSFLGDHGETIYKSGRVLTQYGFAAGNYIIVSFLGDHGESLVRERVCPVRVCWQHHCVLPGRSW